MVLVNSTCPKNTLLRLFGFIVILIIDIIVGIILIIDIRETAKDLLENRINRIYFEIIINKLYFEIENDLIDNSFDEKYRKLEELSLKIDLNELSHEFTKGYKKIKEFIKEQKRPAFLFN